MEAIVVAIGYVVAPMIILTVGFGITIGLASRAFGLHTHRGWRRGAQLEMSLVGIFNALGAVLSFFATLFMYATLLPAWEHQLLGLGPIAFAAIALFAYGGPITGGPTRKHR